MGLGKSINCQTAPYWDTRSCDREEGGILDHVTGSEGHEGVNIDVYILSIHLAETTLRLNPMLTYVTAMSYAKITQTSAQRTAWRPDSYGHNEGAGPTSKVNN